MTIQLENISKRFGFEWIFKQVNFQFESGGKYAVVGPNGSGKSTLLKIVSGGLVPTSGKMHYSIPHKRVTDFEAASKEIVFAAPYISVIDDFTLEEMYDFHATFKKMNCESKEEFYAVSQLGMHKNKYIKNFSSGMRQRLKLALAFLTLSQVLLLDEPTSNFDTKAIDWYLSLIESYSDDRLVIVGSNQEYEYSFCTNTLIVSDYK
ncbi:MAG: ABC transporter ATP-binding protein [Sphingobacteriales bacterium]|jgi:ABC-type multidrug transport system ATPase subunit|nr:ABC transporter ATP-binding protein [Sphingobacteriales bacterium]